MFQRVLVFRGVLVFRVAPHVQLVEVMNRVLFSTPVLRRTHRPLHRQIPDRNRNGCNRNNALIRHLPARNPDARAVVDNGLPPFFELD